MRNKEWWNNFWSSRNDYGEPNKTLVEFASNFFKERNDAKASNSSMTAVDIASGNGRYAIELTKLGYVTDAIELSDSGVDRILAKIEKENIKLKVTRGNFIKLCKSERQYDLVLSSGLLEEVDQEHHEDLIKGFISWTKPGGLNIIKYCLEISGRGNLVKDNFVNKFYEKTGWKILFFKENPQMKKSNANMKFDGSYDARIRTGTLVALNPKKL